MTVINSSLHESSCNSELLSSKEIMAQTQASMSKSKSSTDILNLADDEPESLWETTRSFLVAGTLSIFVYSDFIICLLILNSYLLTSGDISMGAANSYANTFV